MHLANTKDINSLSGAHLRCLPAFSFTSAVVMTGFSCILFHRPSRLKCVSDCSP